MRKILYSSFLVVAVVAIAGYATYSYFSDTETSTGNTFTAGAIDLKVDSTQHYNGNECRLVDGTYKWVGNSPYPVEGTACDGTWLAKDLGAEKFFNFTDIKPGDSGENTISLLIDNNDAWACIDVNITKNDDVSSTEPELGAGDVQDTADLMDGELAQNIKFAAWADDGDNVWETGEPLLFSNQSGPASDVLGGKTYALADSTTGGVALTGGQTRYIGLAWCAGTQTVDTGANTITCSGAAMDNMSQTDSMEASVAFRVEQARNNSSFKCQKEFVLTDPSDANVVNQTTPLNGLPYFTYVIHGLSIDLTLHNPTAHNVWFDYIIDGELGYFSAGTSDIVLSQGPLSGQTIGNLYHPTKVTPAEGTKTITLTGINEIKVGMRFGPEQHDFLDWATFTAQ